MYICIYVYMYICIYVYMYICNPPMNYRPSFRIVNTASNQLFRQVRILYLSKTTENKLRFQENVSVNSFKLDVRSGSCLSRTTEINLTFQQDVSVNSFRFDVST